jgi:hypothetical protein
MRMWVTNFGSTSNSMKKYPIILHSFFFTQKLHQNIQTSSKTHSTSYPVGTGGPFPEAKRSECEEDYSPQSSIEVNNGGAKPPLPHMSSWYSA